MRCRIGRADARDTFFARERLVGTEERFEYARCPACGCVQIVTVPADLARHYGGDYGTAHASPFKTWARAALYRAVDRPGFVSRALGLAFPPANAGVLAALRARRVPRDASVLDVGAGSGRFLLGLRALGYTGRLIGVDPFLSADRRVRDVTLLSRELADVEGRFDVITMIHTLEHLPDQVETLRHVCSKLAPGGVAVITVPLAGGWADEHYGIDWVQLDPPRHLYLHTERSLTDAACQSGLTLLDVTFDSTSFQFWGSERVRRRQPILPFSRSYLVSLPSVPRGAWRAARLNARRLGDQATFTLQPADRSRSGSG